MNFASLFYILLFSCFIAFPAYSENLAERANSRQNSKQAKQANKQTSDDSQLESTIYALQEFLGGNGVGFNQYFRDSWSFGLELQKSSFDKSISNTDLGMNRDASFASKSFVTYLRKDGYGHFILGLMHANSEATWNDRDPVTFGTFSETTEMTATSLFLGWGPEWKFQLQDRLGVRMGIDLFRMGWSLGQPKVRRQSQQNGPMLERWLQRSDAQRTKVEDELKQVSTQRAILLYLGMFY